MNFFLGRNKILIARSRSGLALIDREILALTKGVFLNRAKMDLCGRFLTFLFKSTMNFSLTSTLFICVRIESNVSNKKGNLLSLSHCLGSSLCFSLGLFLSLSVCLSVCLSLSLSLSLFPSLYTSRDFNFEILTERTSNKPYHVNL